MSKNRFFVNFTMKTVCFCGFTPEFIKICVFLEMITFFFRFSPQILSKFEHLWRKSPEFEEIRVVFEMMTLFFCYWSFPQILSNFAMSTFFLVHTFKFKEIKFSCPQKICLCPPSPVTLSWHQALLVSAARVGVFQQIRCF